HRVSQQIRAGMVWVNGWGGGDCTMPFGGVKASGNGRDKSLHSLEKYTELKTVWISL
ncbi:MAG: aldehyde dehydrogenase family protein, partial [Halopseudomonas sp.]